ncbi:toll/interleukin-1 receptor domain-containing protein [Ideonella sp. DXS29W]|uniref:Toll/interleukin-1 receptor domain-containing protein n=1 Tax=Ideonella lacteola TaxID=2984193 RepID=A0ABU9BVY8_9BURK
MPSSPGPLVFISYRRDDAAGYARAIASELSRRWGADRVFIDVDDIGAGQGFAQVIGQAVDTASILLVLIGRRWRGEREGQAPRVQDPGDFVRLEVAAGLQRGMTVIPLLLDGAAMPPGADLPPDIQALSSLQALELGNSRFAADVERLVAVVGERLGSSPVQPGRRGWIVAAAGALGAALLAGGWWARSRSVARPAIDGDWVAELRYAWEPAPRTERFHFTGEGRQLAGTASFLGVPRGLVEGEVDERLVRFATRTAEMGGAEMTHRYQGRLDDDGVLRLMMQTEGGSGPNAPLEFVARRAEAHAPR